MGNIKQLPPHEAIKIAAGEVVERPSNIVKELVENALDANASSIRVSVQDGGRTSIRVTDDGCGMDSDDAQLCFAHHATSKLHTIDELVALSSFGFRGEALSSIASVANVTLCTRRRDDDVGTRVVVQHGELTSISPHAAPPGTSITITELFDNVPARKKFLRNKDTEFRGIQQLVHAYALAHHSITFRFEHNGKVVMQAPTTRSLLDRFAQVKDHTLARNCVELITCTTTNGATVSGIISNHQVYRYDRSLLLCFVNGRWIKNYQLANACISGYTDVLPHGRYPAAVLFVEIDKALVDVNVHPRKEEVQFAHPHRIRALITAQVKATLEQLVTATLGGRTQLTNRLPQYSPALPATSESPTDRANHLEASSPYQKQTTSVVITHSDPKPTLSPAPSSTHNDSTKRVPKVSVIAPSPPAAVTQQTVPTATVNEPIIIGQLLQTYILIQHEQQLIIVDQHAAHERVLYEQLCGTFEKAASVQLLFAETIHLGTEIIICIEPYLSVLQACGLTLELSGPDSLLLRAKPVHCQRLDIKDLLLHTAAHINTCASMDRQTLQRKISWHVHSHMACKTAVRAGMTLTQTHMTEIVSQLLRCPNHLTCPHGRPTLWTITQPELEKFFKRIQ